MIQLQTTYPVFLLKWVGVLTVWAGLFYSCQKVEFDTGAAVKIHFSTDTLTFDTVFTQVGSTTRYFKIYNESNRYARLDEIRLGEKSSVFRLNVDGYQGPVIQDLEIPPNDSVYVFVEVTVDPDQPLSVSPFVIDDQVEVSTGSESSVITLTAWGQNANYIPALKADQRQVLITCDMNTWTWDDPKPYVIYGVVIIDSCTLDIPAGTDVYVHGGKVFSDQGSYNDGVLFIGKNGTLKLNGTADDPVTFQSDRLEAEYQDRIAQWGRIQLGAESKNNVITHARLRHANIGILVDSLAQLSIDHTIIGYNGAASLAGFKGIVTGSNNLFHSSAGNNLRVDYGGYYRFDYCTFANVGFGEEAVGLTNFFCFQRQEDGQCSDPRASILNLEMRNSILYSSKSDALAMSDATNDPSYFKVDFKNSVIRMDQLLEDKYFPDFLKDYPTVTNYKYGDPLFFDPGEYDFSLDTMSIARDLGQPLPGVTDDLIGRLRDIQTPDAGAYEFE
ncbi:hypothetical protein KUV50_17160 [Membranicola marinus]|uniref:Right handed beta helix region n=1 Tax=Membranihabitans marinus TaxID=1227546 RepID=A0A953HQG4_9BACT|nr:hypothetical protein [Membranihabitans marinus]MBY5959887.1 hypothetical protein [Membranihabitans marinus]